MSYVICHMSYVYVPRNMTSLDFMSQARKFFMGQKQMPSSHASHGSTIDWWSAVLSLDRPPTCRKSTYRVCLNRGPAVLSQFLVFQRHACATAFNRQPDKNDIRVIHCHAVGGHDRLQVAGYIDTAFTTL